MRTCICGTILITLGVALLTPAAADPAPLTSRAADGREYFDGRLLLKLTPAAAARIDRASLCRGRTGIADLDAELDPLSPDSSWPLYLSPRPTAAAVARGCDRWFALRYRAAADPLTAAARIERLPGIEAAEAEGVLRACEVPSDSLYGRQWHLEKIGAPAAWDLCHGDTTVVIGLIDNGYEWHHPDIEANIAINRREDINGNGRFDSLPFPAGDIDGIDQDSNGLADDVVGFNYMSGGANPAPDSTNLIHSHGTHCWGIANAVTNNCSGIAAPPWNCRAIACRCGTGPIMSPAAVASAIYYLVDRGARILSLSFGSTSPNQAINDACSFAWESGCLVVAGAGNNGDSIPFYPAASEHVIAVAGSDPGDGRPYWSNYGSWVDVSAPGASILSTVAGHGYGTISGTSMATPLVAGALAWIWSLDPATTNTEVESTLLAACDTMPDPLYAQGLLGRGRISIGNIARRRTRCNLQLAGWRFNDAGGNANGRLDPGETAALIVRLRNLEGWRDAGGVSAALSASEPGITILRARAAFPDITAGDSADCSLDSFVIRADDSLPPCNLDFGLTISATPSPVAPDTGIATRCGSPRILLVDDDSGAAYEEWYTAALDSNRVLYSVHDVSAAGSPPAESLLPYPVVIWFCGNDSVQTLGPMDRSALVTYTRAGGNLFISGQNIAQDLSRRQPAFLTDYLRATLATDSTGRMFIPGLRSDPVTRGETLVTGGTGGANNAVSNDGIRAVNGSEPCAFYRDHGDTTVLAMLRYSGSYRLVFLAAPFEAVDHSPARYLQRWTLLRRVLEWFGERVPAVAAPGPVSRSGRFALHPTITSDARNVRWTAPGREPVRLRVFAADGRLVADCMAGADRPDEASLPLPAALAPGAYLIRIQGRSMNGAAKLVISR